jgi:hypothetical protein
MVTASFEMFDGSWKQETGKDKFLTVCVYYIDTAAFFVGQSESLYLEEALQFSCLSSIFRKA